MAIKILQLVTERKHVSFAEMSRMIDGFGDGSLEIALRTNTVSNIVLWSGLTQEAVDALEELREARQIHPVPASFLTYLADGCVLRLPLVKSKRHYKIPHWLPMVFNPGPPPAWRATSKGIRS